MIRQQSIFPPDTFLCFKGKLMKIKAFITWLVLAISVATLGLSRVALAVPVADFVFIIDATVSMAGEIAATTGNISGYL